MRASSLSLAPFCRQAHLHAQHRRALRKPAADIEIPEGRRCRVRTAQIRRYSALQEFGIDIVCEEIKTIIHHKVAARVTCIFNVEDVLGAERETYNFQQQQNQQTVAGPAARSTPLRTSVPCYKRKRMASELWAAWAMGHVRP
ncbi:hypothetical protein DFH11DRAFT_121837 [Phellopilus nigrolimitatus]|nr:hypothetical protein DFH11DRAFT_121837 [Phellopilus nigrolimitatus]